MAAHRPVRALRRGREPRRLRPRLPNLATLRAYEPGWARGDVLAGLTVAAYLIPQVMAYAGVAGLPPVVGLWTAVPALAIYACLGSSRRLSVGPESTTALLAAATVAPLANGDPERYAVLTAMLATIVGLYCLLAWVLRLGFVADLLSRPVLVGYLAGLAVVMVAGQLGRVSGVPVTGEAVWPRLASLLGQLDRIRIGEIAIAAATAGLLLLTRARAPRLPGPLLAVVAATLAVAAFDLERHGVSVVGAVDNSLPDIGAWSFADLDRLLLPALGIFVVGYVDNVLTARSFAEPGEEFDADAELLALGAINLGAGAVQGFPVSSSASRTALAVAAGSRTQLYSLVALAVVLTTLVLGGSLLARFPVAALGALVIYAACRLVELAEIRRLARFRRSELALAAAAAAGVVTVDILYGIGIAVGLSVADLLARVARPHDAVLGMVPDLAGMHDVDDYPGARQIDGLIVYRYDSPLFFANAEDFRRRALAAVEGHDGPVAWFVLNMEANVEVDITGLDALESLRTTLAARGIVVGLARVKQDLYGELESFGLVESIGRSHIFPTLPSAVDAYRTRNQAPVERPEGAADIPAPTRRTGPPV
jgi:SulP family sulfate permease